MRRLTVLFMVCLAGAGCGAGSLSRNVIRKQIASVASADLVPGSIEVRRVTFQGKDQAIVDTTVTLALQFRKNNPSDDWFVDAVRLGDRDWLSMSELLAAIGAPRTAAAPTATSRTEPPVPPTETFHVNNTEFEKQRRSVAEIGASPLVPDALEIQRVVSQNEKLAIAESTVTLSFQFSRTGPNRQWRIDAARLGDREWVNVAEVLAAFNEGRRRDTAASMQKLVAGINNYRAKAGALPAVIDIIDLTDLLHPIYMTDLVRTDGWGREIVLEVAGPTFRLVSRGPDGLRGTSDDVIVNAGSPASP